METVAGKKTQWAQVNAQGDLVSAHEVEDLLHGLVVADDAGEGESFLGVLLELDDVRDVVEDAAQDGHAQGLEALLVHGLVDEAELGGDLLDRGSLLGESVGGVGHLLPQEVLVRALLVEAPEDYLTLTTTTHAPVTVTATNSVYTNENISAFQQFAVSGAVTKF